VVKTHILNNRWIRGSLMVTTGLTLRVMRADYDSNRKGEGVDSDPVALPRTTNALALHVAGKGKPQALAAVLAANMSGSLGGQLFSSA